MSSGTLVHGPDDNVIGAVIAKEVWLDHQVRWATRYFAMTADGKLIGRTDGYLHEKAAASKLTARRSYERRTACTSAS